MIKTQYIRLDMTPGGTPPVLFCSQYDVGRPLGMVVYNGGEAVDLSTYTCTIEATRTDGTAITAAVTTDGNIGAFATTATMTNQKDRYPAKLVIVDGSGNRVASLTFVMCITPATMDENAESIEEDASLYQQYTETVQTLIAEIREDITDLNNDLTDLNNDLTDADNVLFARLSTTDVITRKRIKEGLEYFTNSDDYTYLQGACLDTNNNHIYIAVPKQDYTDCKLIEIQIESFEGVYTKVNENTLNNLGHANDMTYNSNTDRLAVINENKIVIINPTTLAVESEHVIEQNMTCIDYDASENIYYCHYAMDVLLLVDGTSYETVAKYTTYVYRYLTFASQMFVGQGGFINGDYFVRIYTKTPLDDRVGYQIHYLVFIKKDSGEVAYVVTFWSETGGCEVQAGWTDGSNIVLLAGGNAFTLMTLNYGRENIKIPSQGYYGGFNRLANGADMGNRTIPGFYVTKDDEDTQSLSSKPASGLSGPISLDVRQHGLYDIRQMLTDANNEIFTRLWINFSWSSWARLLSDKNVTISNANGYKVIDIKPLKVYILFGNCAVSNITWENMSLAGKQSQQMVAELPDGYNITAYYGGVSVAATGLVGAIAGVGNNQLKFRILTFSVTPTSANAKIFFIATYS